MNIRKEGRKEGRKGIVRETEVFEVVWSAYVRVEEELMAVREEGVCVYV